MRVYIVTKNDYRYVNGRFFPVDTFDTNIKRALDHIHILVGVYDSLNAAEAAVDKNIRVRFNINEVIGNYKSSIQIRKYYFGDSSRLNEKIDVILPNSDGLDQIQMIYHITIKDFETPVDDDKKGIQLKDLKSEDIDSIAEEAAKKLSEENDKKDAAVQCYINDHDIDFVGKNNKQSSVTITENNGHETYNEDLLYELSLHTDIFTRFYDMRSREFGNNLVIELTGVFPDKDNFNPNNTSTLAAYITDPVEGRKCIYEDTYNGYNETGIFSNFFDFLNYYYENINEFDNVYIVDKRHLSEQKEPSKEEEKKPEKVKEYQKAIECTIYNPHPDRYDEIRAIFKFKNNKEDKRTYVDSIDNLMDDLKKYTDSNTRFIDRRIGSPGYRFYDNYDCYIIEIDDEKFTLKHYIYDIECTEYFHKPVCFEKIFDPIKGAKALYINDKRVNSAEKEPSKEEQQPEVDEEPSKEEEQKPENIGEFKAIECTITTSDYYINNTIMIFKFKIDGSTKSLTIVAANTEDFITYLKHYTDSNTRFIDRRVGSPEYRFCDNDDCYIIAIYDEKIILKHYTYSDDIKYTEYFYKPGRYEKIFDQIEDAKALYINDKRAW